MPLSVIGAGMPRTGTMSLKLALEQLGFGPCYHMLEAVDDPKSWPLWIEASRGGALEWEDIFAGWTSACDAPAADFYKELVARYPDAKVILTHRDAERWYDSVMSTIARPEVTGFHAEKGSLAMVEAVGWAPAQSHARGREAMIARFHAHNAEVRRTVPAERLLEFEASQGWEPLCRFLRAPVPDTPYPRVNSTEDFGSMIPAEA